MKKLSCVFLWVGILLVFGFAGSRSQVAGQQAQPNNPANMGPCAVSSQSASTSGTAVTIYYPTSLQCRADLKAPYPGVAFAHGFSMFGFSDGRADNAGNGQHLASWGFVVAIPTLDDDAEIRAGALQSILDFLVSETNSAGSFLSGRVDTTRLATAGYSLGGTTALMVAARDSRVQSVVALDPVYHTGGPAGGDPIWNPATEAPDITVPVGILGSPGSSCNDNADFEDIYGLLGASHKAAYEVLGASHCVFADPGSSFCSFVCSGSTGSDLTLLSQSYMTAWFNYYLQYQTEMFTYLYGEEAAGDVNSGRIDSQIDTAPQGFSATGFPASVLLSWEVTNNPMVEGYHIYRRRSGIPYLVTPTYQIPNQSSYLDAVVAADTTYYYELNGHDPAGNAFQRSAEVSGSPLSATDFWFLPLLLR